MSVRFAAANNPVRQIGWRAAGRGMLAPALARAVNDNPRLGADPAPAAAPFDPLLTEAIRHFAIHGLAAATAALAEAEDAGRRDDGQVKAHWLAITQLFDRRLAASAGSD